MLTITLATSEDAREIHAIQMRAFAAEAQLSGTDKIPPLLETVDSVEEMVQSQRVLKAQIEGMLVGSARGLVQGQVCRIQAVSVDPSHQGQGVGGALLKAVEARHPEISRFELTANTLVPGTVSFYERHGYSVRELTKYGDVIILAQMQKTAHASDAEPLVQADPLRHAAQAWSAAAGASSSIGLEPPASASDLTRTLAVKLALE
jgi:GNAT superfamily N-acetyltransferase